MGSQANKTMHWQLGYLHQAMGMLDICCPFPLSLFLLQSLFTDREGCNWVNKQDYKCCFFFKFLFWPPSSKFKLIQQFRRSCMWLDAQTQHPHHVYLKHSVHRKQNRDNSIQHKQICIETSPPVFRRGENSNPMLPEWGSPSILLLPMLVGLRLSRDVPRRGFSCIMYHQSCQFHGNFTYLAGICHLIRNNKEKNFKVIKGLN